MEDTAVHVSHVIHGHNMKHMETTSWEEGTALPVCHALVQKVDVFHQQGEERYNTRPLSALAGMADGCLQSLSVVGKVAEGIYRCLVRGRGEGERGMMLDKHGGNKGERTNLYGLHLGGADFGPLQWRSTIPL